MSATRRAASSDHLSPRVDEGKDDLAPVAHPFGHCVHLSSGQDVLPCGRPPRQEHPACRVDRDPAIAHRMVENPEKGLMGQSDGVGTLLGTEGDDPFGHVSVLETTYLPRPQRWPDRPPALPIVLPGGLAQVAHSMALVLHPHLGYRRLSPPRIQPSAPLQLRANLHGVGLCIAASFEAPGPLATIGSVVPHSVGHPSGRQDPSFDHARTFFCSSSQIATTAASKRRCFPTLNDGGPSPRTAQWCTVEIGTWRISATSRTVSSSGNSRPAFVFIVLPFRRSLLSVRPSAQRAFPGSSGSGNGHLGVLVGEPPGAGEAPAADDERGLVLVCPVEERDVDGAVGVARLGRWKRRLAPRILVRVVE